MSELVLEAGSSLLVAVVVLLLGWLVGNRLTLQWSLRQKKRELELGSLSRLYELYGEFFAIWKLWNQKFKDENLACRDDQWKLFQQACTTEGHVEAFVLKIVVERSLGEAQLHLLGRFRQAFQSLRESIRRNQPLLWDSSDPGAHPEYASFKELSYRVAVLLFDAPAILKRGSPPEPLNMLKVTSNHWEDSWVDKAAIDDLDSRYWEWRRKAPTL